MRIFAELIGVPLVVVRSLSDLASTIEGLASYDRVFIDTAGRSPRDRNPICELVRALLEVDGLEIHLAVPATFTPQLVDEWVRTYGAINVDRLLFTKIDEAPVLTELVEAPSRVGRPVSFITTGQRVPEDIESATPARLLELAGRGFLIEGEEVAA
jgi:flagellar biosynthesis protein FlhF